MSKVTLFFLLSLVTLAFAGAGTKQLRKQDLPGLVDVAPLFTTGVAAYCKIDVLPASAPTEAKPCSCSDVSVDIPAALGPLAPTTCFRITSLEAVTVQLRIVCTDKAMNAFDPSSLRLVITDTAPTCRNYTIAVAESQTTKFFLLASDPDDDYFEYHVRNASWSTMLGTLKYCVNCESDLTPTTPDWKLYSDVAEIGGHRFARMFSYTPPEKTVAGWSETIAFTARDLSDQSCPTDGMITFLAESVTPPTVVSSQASVEIARSTVVTITTSGGSSPLAFTLATIPSCGYVCRLPEAARVILRDFPGEPLSGSILEPCGASEALKAGNDITVYSSKPTFWNTTFLVVNVPTECSASPLSFGVTASLHGVASAVAQQNIKVVQKTRRCISYQHTFDVGKITRFAVSDFLSIGSDTARLTTLTQSSAFQLNLQNSPLRASLVTEQSELTFSGTSSVSVSVYVKTGDVELFCTIDLTARGAPPPVVSPSPTPSSAPTSTPAPTPQAFETPGASSARTTFVLVLAVSGVVLAYYFRTNIVRFFVSAPAQPRRYGVVSGDTDD